MIHSKVLLPVRVPRQIGRSDLLRHAPRLREVPLRVRDPRSRIDGVPHLLCGQLQTRDVDDLEPVDLLGRLPLAEVDHQLVVEELSLDVLGLAVEVLRRKVELPPREVAVEVLAERERPLLPVHHLERAVWVLRPVHDVEREPLHHRRDDGVALLLAVYELALVCGADVEPSAEPPYSGLRVVDVSFDELAHRYLVQFDLHGVLTGLGLR